MKNILFGITILMAVNSHAQTAIKLEEAASHIGDSVHVCGQVYGVKFYNTTTTSLTFINLGAAYPHQLLTVVIGKDARATFEKTPEELFDNKTICVDGKIELYKGKPQIVIAEKKQITIESGKH